MPQAPEEAKVHGLFGVVGADLLPDPGAYPNLRRLAVSCVEDAAWLRRLGPLPQLQHAALHGLRLRDGAELTPLPALTRLELTSVGDPLRVHLAGYPALQRTALASYFVFEGGISSTQLRELELQAPDDGPVPFGALPALQRLKLFYGAHTAVRTAQQGEEAGAASLAGAAQLQVRAWRCLFPWGGWWAFFHPAMWRGGGCVGRYAAPP